MMDTTQVGFTGQNVFKDLTCPSRISSVSRAILSPDIRKAYPLRRRLSPAMNDKTCTVVLTRLEDVAGPCIIEGQSGASPGISCWVDDCGTLKVHTGLSSKTQRVSSKGKVYSGVTSCMDNNHDFPEPRKRRLASLNAEAVNNLLFERDNGHSRKIRKGFGEVSDNRISNGNWTNLKKPNCHLHGKKSMQRCIPSSRSEGNVFDNEGKVEGNSTYYPPAPKRLASLNAAAFLKLTHEKGHPPKQRGKSDGDNGRSVTNCTKPKLKPSKPHKKICIKSKKELLHRKVEDHHGWQMEGDSPFLKPQHRDPSKLLGRTEGIHVEQSSNNCDGSESMYHRLPLMGGQASMKPEYGRPGEKSPTPKQDFQQPSFPVQQLLHLPVPGSPTDCVCLYNSSDVTSFNGTHVPCGQSGLPYSGYCDFTMYPKDELFSQTIPCEELLVSQSSIPPNGTVGHLHWSNPRYSFGGDTGTNTDSLCGMIRLPLSRGNNTHTEHSNYSYKKPFSAEGYKSLDHLSLTIPTAGHPASPAHPLSGCPVPSVPPAAEPVPYLQTPNSEPQTLAMLKTARECPQSSKPPSGSKSGVRNTSGCFHASSNKASKSLSHPKQQRISRRRATNGWMPIGTACEKAVYVVNEPEPALRRSYQAVERNGEIIRVRDTVLLKSGPRKKSMPYVAKISALWEEPKSGELMMSLFWYYRPEHTQGGRNPSMHPNEIFASRHQDENSIACIEEKCYVLTFAEYCRFCAFVKRRGEGCPNRKALIVPPSEEYSTPLHRRVPDSTDPELVFLCRHVYDFRHGRILKNPQ